MPFSGGFSTSQRFALIVLGDGGPDLEAFKFDKRHGWIQAAAIFWQVSNSLARAEEWAKFEVGLTCCHSTHCSVSTVVSR